MERQPRGLDPAFRTRLEAAKRQSIVQLLMRCARLSNELALSRVGDKLGLQLRPSHTALLPHVEFEGTRQSELARRLGVSKQAINQAVAELEAVGLLERIADPSDGRATLVRFTDRGADSLLIGLEVLTELEDTLSEAIGETQLRALHDALQRLNDWFDAGEAT